VINVDEGDSMIIGRARLSINAPEGWTATAYVENINNEDAGGTGLFGIPDWIQRVRPRTTGLQLEYRF
jgi:outer membrane receptor protein involved in Fe transport